jgi:hypothetical protein
VYDIIYDYTSLYIYIYMYARKHSEPVATHITEYTDTHHPFEPRFPSARETFFGRDTYFVFFEQYIIHRNIVHTHTHTRDSLQLL